MYFILKQPIQMFNEVHRQSCIPEKKESFDNIIFHWMVDIYLYALYQKQIFFSQSVRMIPPKWLYAHYCPLHETSIANAWEKAELAVQKQTAE